MLTKKAPSFYFVFEQQKINLVSYETQEEFLLISQRALTKNDKLVSPWITYGEDDDENPTINLHYFESYYDAENKFKKSHYTTFQMTEDFINAIVSCGEIIPNEKSKLVRHVTGLQYCRKGFEEAKGIKEVNEKKELLRKENTNSGAVTMHQNQEMIDTSFITLNEITVSAD